ncbi:PadR family transcriptional regulator [Fusibacter ferrireducens]|uniref:PadR family transcriptional regulator n=1 Tax=Fusibacter ferrireducens TaxID=2785058 RepID=A0ABR9ZMX6_9FIRM|nr:PadR family transcriptional regulator [Fusibacter ferrireducens]MBF4691822.1 PadR family transcriptional regulator [Fusibacter ferrireducens]
MLEYVLLGFLTYGDLTGYEIKKIMTHSTSNFVDASFGSIYPALKRLESKKWISSYEGKTGKKMIKKYSLTAVGKDHFLKWLKAPAEYSPFNHEFLAKIFFFKNIDHEEAIGQIKCVIAGIEARLDGLKKLKNHEGHGELCDINGFEEDTLDYGISNYRHQLEWFNNYLQKMLQKS